MAKKNYTWKLDEDLVSKIQKLAEKEHRSLTNYIEVMFIEKPQSVAVGGEKNKEKNAPYRDWETDRKSTRLNSSHRSLSRMPSSA